MGEHKLEQVTHYYLFGDVHGDIGLNASVQSYKNNDKELDRMYRQDWSDSDTTNINYENNKKYNYEKNK